MKAITKYKDEISGREFDNKVDAICSEAKHKCITGLFAFWRYRPASKGCDFENGSWCYQRSKADYERLQDAIIEAVQKYQPWIYDQYKSCGGLKREHLGSGYIIGRYLDEGGADLIYQHYRVLANICSICYREHGQPYHANHCDHSKEVRPL